MSPIIPDDIGDYTVDEAYERGWNAALESAAPRVVRTVEEIDTLPAGSILIHGESNTVETIPSKWCCNICYGERVNTWRDRIDLPATVLFTPTESGEPQ